jgi:hypothetical protein
MHYISGKKIQLKLVWVQENVVWLYLGRFKIWYLQYDKSTIHRIEKYILLFSYQECFL